MKQESLSIFGISIFLMASLSLIATVRSLVRPIFNSVSCWWGATLTLTLTLVRSFVPQVEIEMIDVGNAGNQADTTGFGAVNYEFSIGKYEVSIKQYCEFLNAVASIEDTFGLYDPQMGGNVQVAGIGQRANGTGWSYDVLDNSGPSGDRPIAYINWWRAARFANWMSNGQPSAVKQDSASTENGAYDIAGADGNAVPLNSENPNTGAPPKFYISKENEWYKTAYYNPELDDGKGGYYKFGTASNVDPGNDVGPEPNQANYITLPDGFLSTTQDPNFQAVNYLTDVGAFSASPSAYGAYDMAGSVWEWCDLEEATGYRYLRGGAWTSYASYIQASYRQGVTVNEAAVNGGFRLASQPGDIIFPAAVATPPSAPESAPPPSSGPPLPTLSDSNMVAIDMVPVRNAGNAPEPSTRFGAVEVDFNIGKYLVTIDQYSTFLNAVATTDIYGLYNERMASDLNIAGIARSGANGSFTYSVIDNGGSSGNRPISYVSFFDAARFANWMSNGQPVGPQDERTTEAGAYPLRGAVAGTVPAKSGVNPNTGEPPSFFIPLEDEWYKAAFYDPGLNDGAGGYWTYATRNNSAPGNRVGPEVNGANYIANSLYSVTQSVEYVATDNYLSDVGAFTSSPSSYGTFDQQGLLGEWNNVDGQASSSMGTRGSFWAAASAGLRGWAYTDAAQESNDLGFRVASPYGAGDVTEPTTPPTQSIAAPHTKGGLAFLMAVMAVL